MHQNLTVARVAPPGIQSVAPSRAGLFGPFGAPETKARSPAPKVIFDIDPPELASPSQDDFKRVRDLLRQRSAALILDLAKRYAASKAAELTTVLDAMDSLAEFERMHRSPVGAAVKPADGGAGQLAKSGISFVADEAAAHRR
jgi:hypothetical protein